MNTVLALINSVFGSFNEELVRVDDSGMNALHIAVSKQAKNVVKGYKIRSLLKLKNNPNLTVTSLSVSKLKIHVLIVSKGI